MHQFKPQNKSEYAKKQIFESRTNLQKLIKQLKFHKESQRQTEKVLQKLNIIMYNR